MKNLIKRSVKWVRLEISLNAPRGGTGVQIISDTKGAQPPISALGSLFNSLVSIKVSDLLCQGKHCKIRY